MKSSLNENLHQYLKNEISLLKQLNSPNLITLHYVDKTEHNYYLIFDYCNGGDILHILQLREKFTEDEAVLILKQILAGYEVIVKNNILHRDLKLENMLIHFPEHNLMDMTEEEKEQFLAQIDLTKEKFIVKIADLGLAKKVLYDGGITETTVGSPMYMAPEVILGNKYNYKADIWSIGTILFEMVTGFPPFFGNTIEDFKEHIK